MIHNITWREAIKKLRYHDEAIIYLDKLFHLHPHNQSMPKLLIFCLNYTVFLVFLGLVLMFVFRDFTGIESLGKTDILIPCYQIAFTIGAYKWNYATLKILLESLNTFWNVESFDIEFQTRIKSHGFKTAIYVYSYKAVIIVGISFYLLNPIYTMGKEPPTQFYQICNLKEPLCYAITILVQYLSLCALTLGIFTFDGLFTSLVFQVSTQLEMIKLKLRALDKAGLTTANAYNELALIIEHHNYILTYTNHLNDFYSPILLSQFLSCTLSLCIGCFLLTLNGVPSLETLLKFLSYLVALFGQVFVYCFGGQILYDVSESIADAAYDIDWWKADIRFKKSILLLILRAQRPGLLSIGAITEANMRMYLYASKTAFSIYTVMNTMYDRKSLD